MTEIAPREREYALGRLVSVLTVLLGLAGLASLATAVPLIIRAGAIDAVAADTATLLDVLDAGDIVTAMFGVNALVTIGTGFCWLVWQYRFTVNAELLADRSLSLGPGWAVGGWFVPFANLVLPFLQLRQAARVCGAVPRVVTAWTVSFIGGAVLFTGSAALRTSHALVLPDALLGAATADRVAAAAMLTYTAAAVFAIRTVRVLTDHQR